MRARKGLVLIATVVLVLSLALCAKAVDSEIRVKCGVLSHRDNLFGNCGFTMGVDHLLHLQNSPFGITGGLEYTYSAKTTFYSDTDWRDIAATLSFLYFPALTREVYLGMGLEYHWVTEEEIYLYTNYHGVQEESGLGLHFVIGFNLTEHIFIEGKISSLGIGYRNKGGISLQIGSKF